MSLAYRILYRLGFTPWEKMAELPVAEQIDALFDREESGRKAPFGPVLDLGCGTGLWSVRSAARGWQVTGLDNVPKALRAARTRARESGVELRLVRGDVTDLAAADLRSDYELFLDFGCFHDELDQAQRAAVGRGVTSIAAPGAALLLMAWSPARRGPMLPRGASREDVQAAFPHWTVTVDEALDVSGAPASVRRAEPRMYRLQRI